MKFEQPPIVEEPKNLHEEINNIPSDKSKEELSKMNLDQKTLLNAKLENDLEKITKEMEVLGTKIGYETNGPAGPIKGEMGLTLDELALEKAKLMGELEKNKDAMSGDGNYKEI